MACAIAAGHASESDLSDRKRRSLQQVPASTFLDEHAARKQLEALRWPDGVVCPFRLARGSAHALHGKSETRDLYYCDPCRKKFTVRGGTVMERSHIALAKWLLATHLIANAQSRLPAGALGRTLGIHYRSAMQMAMSIRLATADWS